MTDAERFREAEGKYLALVNEVERAMGRLYGDDGVLGVRAYTILREALPEQYKAKWHEHPTLLKGQTP